jgi:tRNA-specific 2-thiouridylase
MPETKRVLVAMSGGVDSSCAATLLIEQGYAVQGLTMRLWREPGAESRAEEDIAAARQVCAQLGIRHHVLDLRQAFYSQVVADFISEYGQGHTPNPCVRCNRMLKFGAVLDQLAPLGCDYLATGHYAHAVSDDGGWHLLRGLDARKDQSYFLYMLTQVQLARVLFPLGTWTKVEVRAYARKLGLHLAERGESQDACFVADGDYRRFLRERYPESVRPGPIYDADGRLLGQHKGLPYYTVGQREGLGIAAPKPYYVLALEVARNALIVAHSEGLGRTALIARHMSYVSGSPLAAGQSVVAKIRYRARPTQAQVWPQPDGTAQVTFGAPLRDITPGQSVVLYSGEEVLGGGIVARSLPPEGA